MYDLVSRNRDWFPSVGNFFDTDKIFDNFFSDFSHIFGDNIFKNTDGDYVFEMEVPGFNKDNLDVEVANGVMTIKGERNIENDCCAGKTKVYKRISVGSAEDVDAKLDDGILRVTIKKEKPKDVKKIELK